jgi:hypothetical protein
MIVTPPSARPFSLVDRVGVAITSRGSILHVAFLVKMDEDEPFLLHLAWHHVLICAGPGEGGATTAICGPTLRNWMLRTGGFLRVI